MYRLVGKKCEMGNIHKLKWFDTVCNDLSNMGVKDILTKKDIIVGCNDLSGSNDEYMCQSTRPAWPQGII